MMGMAKHRHRLPRCPIPGTVQGQVGRGSDQPDPMEDVPAHGMGVGLDDLPRSPSNPNHLMIPKPSPSSPSPAVKETCAWFSTNYANARK